MPAFSTNNLDLKGYPAALVLRYASHFVRNFEPRSLAGRTNGGYALVFEPRGNPIKINCHNSQPLWLTAGSIRDSHFRREVAFSQLGIRLDQEPISHWPRTYATVAVYRNHGVGNNGRYAVPLVSGNIVTRC